MSILDEFSRTASSVLNTVADSVVSVGRDGRGTGLVVGDGKVLTNAHNLRDRTTTVTFADGRVADAVVAVSTKMATWSCSMSTRVARSPCRGPSGHPRPATWCSRPAAEAIACESRSA